MEKFDNEQIKNAIVDKVYVWLTSQNFADCYGWSETHAMLEAGSENNWLDKHIRGDKGCMTTPQVKDQIRQALFTTPQVKYQIRQALLL